MGEQPLLVGVEKKSVDPSLSMRVWIDPTKARRNAFDAAALPRSELSRRSRAAKSMRRNAFSTQRIVVPRSVA